MSEAVVWWERTKDGDDEEEVSRHQHSRKVKGCGR